MSVPKYIYLVPPLKTDFREYFDLWVTMPSSAHIVPGFKTSIAPHAPPPRPAPAPAPASVLWFCLGCLPGGKKMFSINSRRVNGGKMTTEVKSRTCAPVHGAGGVIPPRCGKFLIKLSLSLPLSLSLSLPLSKIALQGNDCKLVSKVSTFSSVSAGYPFVCARDAHTSEGYTPCTPELQPQRETTRRSDEQPSSAHMCKHACPCAGTTLGAHSPASPWRPRSSTSTAVARGGTGRGRGRRASRKAIQPTLLLSASIKQRATRIYKAPVSTSSSQ
jgi:hypothetical protein